MAEPTGLIKGSTQSIIDSNVQTLINQGFDERRALEIANKYALREGDEQQDKSTSGLAKLMQVVGDSQKANDAATAASGQAPAPSAPGVDTSSTSGFIGSLLARLKFAMHGADAPPQPQNPRIE